MKPRTSAWTGAFSTRCSGRGRTGGARRGGRRTLGEASEAANTLGEASEAARTLGEASEAARTLGEASEAARTLGEAIEAAKLDLWATGANLDLLDTYLLFGDPATRLPLAPASAPVAPQIAVERVPGMPQVKLTWLNQQEDPFYEVWRGTTPYFDPAGDPRGQVAYLYGEPYGVMGLVPFTDDGQDRYSSGPGDPLLEPVQVTGDPGANYFWVVRGRSGQTVSENSNRAGEFDYPLVGGAEARALSARRTCKCDPQRRHPQRRHPERRHPP